MDGSSEPVTISKMFKNPSSSLRRKRTWVQALSWFSPYSLGLRHRSQITEGWPVLRPFSYTKYSLKIFSVVVARPKSRSKSHFFKLFLEMVNKGSWWFPKQMNFLLIWGLLKCKQVMYLLSFLGLFVMFCLTCLLWNFLWLNVVWINVPVVLSTGGGTSEGFILHLKIDLTPEFTQPFKTISWGSSWAILRDLAGIWNIRCSGYSSEGTFQHQNKNF